jgi:hypothetical protein
LPASRAKGRLLIDILNSLSDFYGSTAAPGVSLIVEEHTPEEQEMNRVLVDDAMRTTLGKLHSQAEFCDESGKVLGYFIPAEQDRQSLREWVHSRISDEELEKRDQEPGALTTAEVLKRLHELESK